MAPMARMDSSQASLLMGDIGPLLLMMRLSPSPQTAEELHARIAANWGLAAVVYAIVGGVVARLLARAGVVAHAGRGRARAV